MRLLGRVNIILTSLTVIKIPPRGGQLIYSLHYKSKPPLHRWGDLMKLRKPAQCHQNQYLSANGRSRARLVNGFRAILCDRSLSLRCSVSCQCKQELTLLQEHRLVAKMIVISRRHFANAHQWSSEDSATPVSGQWRLGRTVETVCLREVIPSVWQILLSIAIIRAYIRIKEYYHNSLALFWHYEIT